MQPQPIIDMDIHPVSSAACPIEPFVPQAMSEAFRMNMSVSPSMGYANPMGFQRRDVSGYGDPHKTIEEHLDPLGLSYAVIQPTGMSVSLISQIDMGNAMATAWNDWQIHHWLSVDERYLGSICVNMRDPVAAVREIDRCADHPQMRQLCICGESDDLYGHRRYFPIYEAAARHHLPITIHPGNEGSLRSATPVGRPSTYFEWHTIIPLTYQAHLVSLVTEGVFEKFPALRFVLCEGGIGWLPHTIWRMEKNFKGLRAMTPWLKRKPSEYVFEHIRLTTQPIEEPLESEHMEQIFNMVHAERTVCFATDYPHWDFDDPTRSLPRTNEALKRRIMYENAAELLGLPSYETIVAKLQTDRPPVAQDSEVGK